MIRFDRSYRRLAVGVAILAGFVDATGFVESGGFFVSFMTGNSTRLAVGAAEWQRAGLFAGFMIVLFLMGVVMGSLLAARAKSSRATAVLSLAALMLAGATALRIEGALWPAIACLALSMGVVNAALEGSDGAVVGVTYMTGTLVQMGQKIANRLSGEGDRRWLHHFGLWLALVGGAIAGARTVLYSVPLAYALATMLAACLTLYSFRLRRRTA